MRFWETAHLPLPTKHLPLSYGKILAQGRGRWAVSQKRITQFLCIYAQYFSVVVYLDAVFFLAEKVNELQELLNKKDQEMKVMEDRYKKYLEKAKSVSKYLWASVQSA